MTPAERSAIIALWAKVPECNPLPEAGDWYLDRWLDTAYAANLARDAIREHIHALGYTTHSHGHHQNHGIKVFDRFYKQVCCVTGPTQLLALITAAHAVAGVGT